MNAARGFLRPTPLLISVYPLLRRDADNLALGVKGGRFYIGSLVLATIFVLE